MRLHIAGMGWVTPLGSGIEAVWERLLRGEEASASAIAGPFENKSYCAFRVPAEALAGLPAHSRLRRADSISRFAVAAGMAALADARSTINSEFIDRTALVLAVSNGGVSYTKRFYHDIIKTGAGSASPLLFPETVFNAPASHLGALRRISQMATYSRSAADRTVREAQSRDHSQRRRGRGFTGARGSGRNRKDPSRRQFCRTR